MKTRYTYIFTIVVILLLSLTGLASAQDEDTLTYTSPDGALTFSYPSSWTVSEEGGQIMVASNEDALLGYELAAGEGRASFVMPAVLEQIGLEPTSPPIEVLETILPMLAEQGQNYEDPQEMTIGLNNVVLALGESDVSQFAVIAYGFDEGTVLVRLCLPPLSRPQKCKTKLVFHTMIGL